ncbi:MAG TPA: chloride channel protein, partial [Phycisphaerales bacterium]|nr:chloride channel protein [Phycisphaerales bacterium]
MLLMGAVVGLLLGRGTAAAMPGLGIDETTFAVLGMAAWFTGSVRAPMTGIVLILEMTGNYNHLFSLCAVSLTSYLTAEWLRDPPLYEALLEEDLKLRGIQEHHDAAPVHVVMSVQHGSVMDERMLCDVTLPPNCLVIGVERGGAELVPTGAVKLRAGDHLTVIVPGNDPAAAMRIVEMCRVP